jgi:hypothetical protein
LIETTIQERSETLTKTNIYERSKALAETTIQKISETLVETTIHLEEYLLAQFYFLCIRMTIMNEIKDGNVGPNKKYYNE